MSALATAFRQLGVTVTSALLQQSETRGDYQLFTLNTLLKDFGLSRPARVQPVQYATPDKLVPAYYVEIVGRRAAPPTTVAWSYGIGEHGSSVVARDQVAHDAAQPFAYRVFAAASGSHPPFHSPLGHGYM